MNCSVVNCYVCHYTANKAAMYRRVMFTCLKDDIVVFCFYYVSWRHHQIETFSTLLAICAGNSPGTGELPPQRPVTRSFDISFDRRLNKWLRKQSRGWWLETPSRPLWRHCNNLREVLNGVHPLRAHSGGIWDSSNNALAAISRPILWW